MKYHHNPKEEVLTRKIQTMSLFKHFSWLVEITTVEGILSRCIAGLEQDQPVRKALDPDSAQKIEAFIEVLIETKSLKKQFTIVSSMLWKCMRCFM